MSVRGSPSKVHIIDEMVTSGHPNIGYQKIIGSPQKYHSVHDPGTVDRRDIINPQLYRSPELTYVRDTATTLDPYIMHQNISPPIMNSRILEAHDANRQSIVHVRSSSARKQDKFKSAVGSIYAQLDDPQEYTETFYPPPPPPPVVHEQVIHHVQPPHEKKKKEKYHKKDDNEEEIKDLKKKYKKLKQMLEDEPKQIHHQQQHHVPNYKPEIDHIKHMIEQIKIPKLNHKEKRVEVKIPDHTNLKELYKRLVSLENELSVTKAKAQQWESAYRNLKEQYTQEKFQCKYEKDTLNRNIEIITKQFEDMKEERNKFHEKHKRCKKYHKEPKEKEHHSPREEYHEPKHHSQRVEHNYSQSQPQIIQVPVERIVERPYEVIKTVPGPTIVNEKIVEVPVERIVYQDVPFPQIVEKIIEVPVTKEVYIPQIEKQEIIVPQVIEREIPVEKIIHIEVPDKFVLEENIELKAVIQKYEIDLKSLSLENQHLKVANDRLFGDNTAQSNQFMMAENDFRNELTIEKSGNNKIYQELKGAQLANDDLKKRVQYLYQEIETITRNNEIKNFELNSHIETLDNHLKRLGAYPPIRPNFQKIQ